MKLTYQYLILAIGSILLLTGCRADDDNYLVRETDTIAFSTPLSSTKEITLRCNGSWKTVIPEGAEWISTTPSEGVGDGSFERISVSASHNRKAERTATIYLENGGAQYPITVTQADGAVVFGQPYVEWNLVEQEVSKARLCFTYANAYGDETINVSCVLSGDCAGLSVADTSFPLDNGGATIALDISGTPTTSGYATFDVKVDNESIGTVRTKVYSVSEMPIEGLPVTWKFCDVQGGAEELAELRTRKPEWIAAEHTLYSENQNAYITIVEAADKSTTAVNSWAYNNGHAYVKGLFVDDYWLMTIPVKYISTSTKINVAGSIGGSGSSAGFFIIEYSSDATTWHEVPGAVTETFNSTSVTYHVRVTDSYLATQGAFSCTFTPSMSILSGNLYIRLRVSANVRVTAASAITTGGGGSTRLKGTFSVSAVDDNI